MSAIPRTVVSWTPRMLSKSGVPVSKIPVTVRTFSLTVSVEPIFLSNSRASRREMMTPSVSSLVYMRPSTIERLSTPPPRSKERLLGSAPMSAFMFMRPRPSPARPSIEKASAHTSGTTAPTPGTARILSSRPAGSFENMGSGASFSTMMMPFAMSMASEIMCLAPSEIATRSTTPAVEPASPRSARALRARLRTRFPQREAVHGARC